LYRRICAAHQLHACNDAFWRDNVAPFAIGIAEKREIRAAIRIIFQPLHFGCDSILVAAEIHDAVMLLVTTAYVTGSDLPLIVTPGSAILLLHQVWVRCALVQASIDDFDYRPTTWRGRFDFNQRHYLTSP